MGSSSSLQYLSFIFVIIIVIFIVIIIIIIARLASRNCIDFAHFGHEWQQEDCPLLA